MNRFTWACMLGIAMAAAMPALGGPSKDVIKGVVEEFNLEPRAVRPDHMLLPVNYLEHDDYAYGYGVSRRFARLAGDGEQFRIRNLKVKKRYVLVELETGSGAKLDVQVFDQDRVSQPFLDHVVPAVLRTLFVFGPRPAADPFVGNTASNLLHLGGCNHLPAADQRRLFVTVEECEAAGFRPCLACFPREAMLPFEGYAGLRKTSAEEARLLELAFPRVDDAEAQARVEEIGQKILAAFPLDLAGFEYRFTVVQSPLPNAFAVATGYVYVTDALLEIIEHPAELEFILAHEIAHCELNLPPIGSDRPEEAPVALSDPYKYVFEWMRFRETTSDLVALLHLAQSDRESVDAARMILAKLQFAHEALPSVEAADYSPYPSFGSRLKLFDEQSFQPRAPGPALSIEPPGTDGPVEIRVLGKALVGGDAVLFLLAEGTDLMNKPWQLDRQSGVGAEFAEIEFAGGGRFDLVNRHFYRTIEAGDVQVLVARFGRAGDFDKLDINAPIVALKAANAADTW